MADAKLVTYKNRVYEVVLDGKSIGQIAERNGFFCWRTKAAKGRSNNQDNAYKEVLKNGS